MTYPDIAKVDMDDPTHIIGPENKSISTLTSATTSERSQSLSARAPAARRSDDAPFYVEIPVLSAEEKRNYQRLDWSVLEEDSEDEDASSVIEIEGEYTIGRTRYLYARYEDNIVRREEASVLKARHPDLYDDYQARKARGELKFFDPSSTRIQPTHRINIVLNISTRNIGNKNTSVRRPAGATSYVSDSQSSDEDVDDREENDTDGKYGGSRILRHRGTGTKYNRPLPFSLKKTRNRANVQSRYTTLDTESQSESEQGRHQRRSSRSTKRKVYTFDNDSDYESVESDNSEEYSRPTRKMKRVVKKNHPKPAYGQIRNVEELYDSDPETAPLRAHRDECERCHRVPAHILLQKAGRKKAKREDGDGLSENNEEFFYRLGGWVRCLKCCVAAHWRCLAETQRAEIVKAARLKAEIDNDESNPIHKKIKNLEVNEATEFVCGSCTKGGICMVCEEVVIEAESNSSDHVSGDSTKDTMSLDDKTLQESISKTNPNEEESSRELLFRCITCKRLAHYSHLPDVDGDLSKAEVAKHYQKTNGWRCSDCASYVFPLDKIIAWRPHPASAIDPYVNSQETMNYKTSIPRQYLVKWAGRSFRRTEWVPHMWLVSTHWVRLKNFYENGPRMDLLEGPIMKEQSAVDREKSTELALFSTGDENSRNVSIEAQDTSSKKSIGPPAPLPDAEERIPPLWKTIDRVLDILLWAPQQTHQHSKKNDRSSKRRVNNSDSEGDIPSDALAEYDAALDTGEEPSDSYTESVEDFEKRTGRKFCEEDIRRVIWAFIKWDDLPYDEATWDSPPRPGSFGYTEFERAYKYFLLSRLVEVKKKSATEIERFEKRDGKKNWDSTSLGIAEDGRYDIGQDEKLRLMPFQADGVNWLCRNWFHHQQCILADEMGLGKTVQIITFLGILHARLRVFPALVVVPNSTITNWVREFAKWAPDLRVVPFYGESKSREIIKKYELQHMTKVAPGTTGAKYHVLVTTYETVTSQKDFNSVFKKYPRWEVLIVDEGQRLKSDSNLIFKRLNELNSCHRIIMTGTPLNNNIRELFNLMSFLDPDDWYDLDVLAKEFEDLDEDRVKDLHERLRPYFLRRVKADVLDLPPKNEVIVPLSMAPLQKEVYKSILSKNLDVLRSLTEASSTRLNQSAMKKSNLRNMLMQLRKCLQHPYLIANDIEPKGLSPTEAHLKLIDASGKLRFLRLLLPRLKARGHRVLLFSQFVIALNIVEDFLQGEGYKFLRLDGDIKQAERQKSMDEFNRENSDIFIFILSTRAGGVGINLWSADTVIIFDPDFNPHQDLQAVARAHRYGQKKTCLVFKLMTKDSAEEKIVQTGKKKLVLDHLIVQKMDDEEEEGNVQSMLTFGANALFVEGQGSRDITYSETDVEKLIDKIETEGDEKGSAESNSNAFAFAKVWSAHKDDLDELPDELEDISNADSWAHTLQKIAGEQNRVEAQEIAGRGVRRKATLVKTRYYEDGSPEKVPKARRPRKSHTFGSSDDEYHVPPTRDISEAPTSGTSIIDGDVNSIIPEKRKRDKGDKDDTQPDKKSPSKSRQSSERLLSQIHSNVNGPEPCGLCGTAHHAGRCPMTKNSKNLVEFREILLHSEEEPYEDRIEAIRSIDETLESRGHIHLISGPLSTQLKGQHLQANANWTQNGSLQQGEKFIIKATSLSKI